MIVAISVVQNAKHGAHVNGTKYAGGPVGGHGFKSRAYQIRCSGLNSEITAWLMHISAMAVCIVVLFILVVIDCKCL